MPAPWDELRIAGLFAGPGTAEPKFGRALERAGAFLADASPDDVLRSAFTRLSDDARNLILGKVRGFDHVGFLAPPGADLGALQRAAKQEGFSEGWKTFPSVVLSAELARLAGGAPVPTTIFKCRRGMAGAEAFIPSAKTAAWNGWVSEDVGTHVAFAADSPGAIAEIAALLGSEGYSMSAGIGRNAGEGVRLVYFDVRESGGRAFRFEFCAAEP
jgi:hypothetical protein